MRAKASLYIFAFKYLIEMNIQYNISPILQAAETGLEGLLEEGPLVLDTPGNQVLDEGELQLGGLRRLG